mmetsp:Transcript_55414/g.109877  ORF Transcript_55414/g.109877 Transcript_55414/m.109877 type:complete len:261 (+) Transcript_55414:34-816(+)
MNRTMRTHFSPASLVAEQMDVMRLIVSFSRALQDVFGIRAVQRCWASNALLDSRMQPTCELFRSITAPFNDRLSISVVSFLASSSLRVLKISGSASISDQSLGVVGQVAVKLDNLDISRCEAVSDSGLCSIARGCRHLRTLDVSQIPRISSTSIVEVAEHCCLLQWVAFRHNFLVDNDALCSLGMRCPCLDTVHAAHSSVSNRGVASLAAGCVGLKELSLSHCGDIGDEALHALGVHCSRLESLSVAYAGNVTDYGIEAT